MPVTGGVGDAGRTCSRGMLVLALALLAATYFLISPQEGRTYPGAIPWGALSILRPLTEVMGLGGVVESVRGVEVKTLALHVAATLGLAWLGVCALRGGAWLGGVRRGPATWAQLLLGGWVVLSLLSSLWSAEPTFATGQALLYALALAWALAVAHTLAVGDLRALLYGVLVITCCGAGLCVWYYTERNPYHRPGFPLGNPGVVAAALLPGILIALSLVVGTVVERRRAEGVSIWPAIGGVVALVPLWWCFALVRGRAALVALVVGVGLMLLFLIGRRLRWILAGVFGVLMAGAGAWWLSISTLDVAMARGATIRFRLYAWRYAAEMWSESSLAQIIGQGAGAYPRVAGALATEDRALDPAAFMAELVEHAHNELLEVLTEIGLVGGVTYVGGFVATVFAASAALRALRPGHARWLVLGLTGSVAALLADAMFGVTLRLPGVPALFYTLLGALWAVSARLTEAEQTPNGARDVRAARAAAYRRLTGGVCLLAAVAAGWVGVRNWMGVQAELAADETFRERRYAAAYQQAHLAEMRILDPVSKVAARKQRLLSRFGMAHQEMQRWQSAAETRPDVDIWADAVEVVYEAHVAALRLAERVPSITHSDAVAARTAEWLSSLYEGRNPERSRGWLEAARRAWYRQKHRTPNDVQTLLALTKYPAMPEQYVALLRDALRFSDAQGSWLASLRRMAERPWFAPTLEDFHAVARPLTPETDLDALVASMAPETMRMTAAYLAEQERYGEAAELAGRAAALYEPMRARFPQLQSNALAERAHYLFRGSPNEPQAAIGAVRAAIAALPEIQLQKYEEMAEPFRMRLALYQLSAGRVDAAVATVRRALGAGAQTPGRVEHLLQTLVYDAAVAGVSPERLEEVTAGLCPEYPTFCADGEGGEE